MNSAGFKMIVLIIGICSTAVYAQTARVLDLLPPLINANQNEVTLKAARAEMIQSLDIWSMREGVELNDDFSMDEAQYQKLSRLQQFQWLNMLSDLKYNEHQLFERRLLNQIEMTDSSSNPSMRDMINFNRLLFLESALKLRPYLVDLLNQHAREHADYQPSPIVINTGKPVLISLVLATIGMQIKQTMANRSVFIAHRLTTGISANELQKVSTHAAGVTLEQKMLEALRAINTVNVMTLQQQINLHRALLDGLTKATQSITSDIAQGVAAATWRPNYSRLLQSICEHETGASSSAMFSAILKNIGLDAAAIDELAHMNPQATVAQLNSKLRSLGRIKAATDAAASRIEQVINEISGTKPRSLIALHQDILTLNSHVPNLISALPPMTEKTRQAVHQFQTAVNDAVAVARGERWQPISRATKYLATASVLMGIIYFVNAIQDQHNKLAAAELYQRWLTTKLSYENLATLDQQKTNAVYIDENLATMRQLHVDTQATYPQPLTSLLPASCMQALHASSNLDDSRD